MSKVAHAPKHWKPDMIGDHVRFEGGTQPPRNTFIFEDQPGYIRLVQTRDFKTDKYKTYIPKTERHKTFRETDVMIGRYGPPVFQIYRGLSGAYNVALIKASPKSKNIDPDFMYYTLKQDRLFQLIDSLSRRSSGQTGVDMEALKSFPLPLPPLPEQRKIAAILRTWDEALEKLNALRAAKARQLDGVAQRFFEAEYAAHNRQMRAKELFETVSERGRPDLPLLAVMQDIGIVRRDELERRVTMPDGDTSTYKVVRPEDFVISLRSFEGGLEYSQITGLVSPAYTVLRPTTQIVGDYYRHFFKSRSFIGRLDKLIFGIRDGKQIAFRDFGDMYIPAPPLDEQSTQAKAIGILEDDLALEDKRIEALTRQKRGLMQKLLTGEWRVEVSDDEEAAA